MVAGRRLIAEKMAQYKPVYSYRFDTVPANITIIYGATHFTEVAYPFPTANTLGTRPGDLELAHLMTSQWASFIHDWTPNNNGVANATEWPNYANGPKNYVFDRQNWHTEVDNFRKEPIAFVNNLGLELSH
ncbi:hypothetical protein JCM8202_000477 [Rhodotorula sphaerocarpa]